MNKWSKRECFEDNQEVDVLINCAHNCFEKAKYKQSMRYMTRKGWKAFKRKKIHLFSEKQKKARLRFAKKYAKLTAEDWDNFLLTDECPKYLFQYPTPEKRHRKGLTGMLCYSSFPRCSLNK